MINTKTIYATKNVNKYVKTCLNQNTVHTDSINLDDNLYTQMKG